MKNGEDVTTKRKGGNWTITLLNMYQKKKITIFRNVSTLFVLKVWYNRKNIWRFELNDWKLNFTNGNPSTPFNRTLKGQNV